ncbi:MAG TPA: hypothetical protein VFJ43_03800 [Bacteroidia bacterium]|nr:hypothetical protein [Bacteroidia bacterium]
MKKIFILIPVLFFFFGGMGCGTGSAESNADSASGKTKSRGVDTTPHEVRKGRAATYAYLPDTSIKSLILGNPESFALFYRNNGAMMNDLGNDHSAISYFNTSKKEEIQLLIMKNAKNKDVIYSMTLQKYGDAGSPLLAKKPLTTSENNFVTGNGIYIGMTQEYVMSVYADQALMQSQHNDTIVLKYKPLEKDKQYFKRYSWKSYSVTYKFVDNALCRLEYNVDPEEFEK